LKLPCWTGATSICFQPLLYQVATGWLSTANIASPLPVVLRKQKNARVLLAEVIDFDLTNRQLILTDGKIGYDTLIVASGSGFHPSAMSDGSHSRQG
jgi:NADH dehydrogenase